MDGRKNTDCHTAEQGWVGAMAMVEVMATTIGKQDGQDSNRTVALRIRPILVEAGSFARRGGPF